MQRASASFCVFYMKNLIVLIAISMFFTLTGCSNDSKSSKQNHETANMTWEEEGRPFMSAAFHDIISTGEADKCLMVDKVVYVGNLSKSPKMIPYCAKAGCKHDDFDCSAYVGENITEFSPYHNKWYYWNNKEDGSHSSLIEHDPKTNERKTLWQTESREENGRIYRYSINPNMIKDGKVYFSVFEMIFDAQGDTVQTEYIHALDIHSGEDIILLEFIPSETPYVLEAVSEKAIFLENEIDIVDIGGGYETYVELLELNLETQEIRTVVSADKKMHSHFHPYGKTFEDDLVYVTDNELHVFDTKTGKDSLIETIEEGRMLDAIILGNVIYWTVEKEDHIGYAYKTDLIKGNTVPIDQPYKDNHFIFSLYGAAGNGVFGELDREKTKVWMNRDAFEQGLYDQAVIPEY